MAAGFYLTFFISPFLVYPFFYWIFNLKAKTSQLKKIYWLPIPFALGNYLILQNTNYSSTPGFNSTLFSSNLYSQSLLDFFRTTTPGEILFQVLKQLTQITLPVADFFNFMQRYINYMNGNQTLDFRFDPEMIFLFHGLFLLTPILYGIALVKIFKQGRQYLTLASTTFVSLIITLILNIYMFSSEVMLSSGSSRLFFLPLILTSFFWGLFFSLLFTSQKLILRVVSVMFIFFWIFYNYNGIEKSNKIQAPMQESNKVVWKYLEEWSAHIKAEPSYVYLPSTFGSFTVPFAHRYYSHPNGKFTDESLDIKELLKTRVNPEDVYVLYYDPHDQVVVDKTQETRLLLQQNINENQKP